LKKLLITLGFTITASASMASEALLNLDCLVQIPKNNVSELGFNRLLKELKLGRNEIILKKGLSTIDSNGTLVVTIGNYNGEKHLRTLSVQLKSDLEINTKHAVLVFGGNDWNRYPAVLESNTSSWFPEQGYFMGYELPYAQDGYLNINYEVKKGFKKEATNLVCMLKIAE
jgi:hypothetical protein